MLLLKSLERRPNMSELVEVLDKELTLEDLCTITGKTPAYFAGTSTNVKLQGTFDVSPLMALRNYQAKNSKLTVTPILNGIRFGLQFDLQGYEDDDDTTLRNFHFSHTFNMTNEEIPEIFRETKTLNEFTDFGVAEGFLISFKQENIFLVEGENNTEPESVRLFNEDAMILEVKVKMLSKDEEFSKRISRIFTSELFMEVSKSDGEFQEYCHSRIDEQIRETRINSISRNPLPKNVQKFIHDNILKSDKAYILDYFNHGIGDPNSNRVVWATNALLEAGKRNLGDKELAEELRPYHRPTVDPKAVYKFLRANEERVKEMIAQNDR